MEHPDRDTAMAEARKRDAARMAGAGVSPDQAIWLAAHEAEWEGQHVDFSPSGETFEHYAR